MTNRSNMPCLICGQRGHVAAACPLDKFQRAEARRKTALRVMRRTKGCILREIAEATGLHKASAYKMLTSMEDRGETVRVKTTVWADKRGLHTKKSLTFLRRQCEGFNVLAEDASAIGAEEVLPRILNFGEVEDGIYEVVVCNESHDYETGYVDDYDYRLVTANDSGKGPAESRSSLTSGLEG